MKRTNIDIMLIDSDSVVADIINDFKSLNNISYKLTHIKSLEKALSNLVDERYDIILLDLFLKDSNGLDTLLRAYDKAPEIPIIIVTSNYSGKLALLSIGHGSHDYLLKKDLDTDKLTRTIRITIEKAKIYKQKDQIKQIKRHSREIQGLSLISGSASTSFTDQISDEKPLREVDKNLYDHPVSFAYEIVNE